MINKQIATSPELQDLQVTQFVVTNGWIGVALGPQYGNAVEHFAEEPESSAVQKTDFPGADAMLLQVLNDLRAKGSDA